MPMKTIPLQFVLPGLVAIIFILFPFTALAQSESDTFYNQRGKIVVSDNKRFLQYENGDPFFWLGDTGWLLFEKLTREEAISYLNNRKGKGFNVIQCILVHELPLANVYGDSAFVQGDISRPYSTPGADSKNSTQYDFWDHVEYIINEAAQRHIYVALVPIWGGVVKQQGITTSQIIYYAHWLAKRFSSKPNIFWMNGGDIQGNICNELWNALGSTIKLNDTNHLITFHPFGRTQSSTWFHHTPWLDFNMFQSGHRRYDQRQNDKPETWKGEDNWRYVLEDYAKLPPKPTLDGEPSYENIPQGLHDTTQPYWKADDCRRYAYWSVFAGACGHTYGDNAVMQMNKPGNIKRSYGVRNYWFEALDDSGSTQMHYLADLILSRPYFERRYDSTLIVDQRDRYEFVIATRGKSYLFAYTFTGRSFTLTMGKISGQEVRAIWYNPRDGSIQKIGLMSNSGMQRFDPPGKQRYGNDWVLILDDSSMNFQSVEHNKR